MKPLIGITCDHGERNGKECSFLYAFYSDAVAAAGGIPVLVPSLTDPGDLPALLSRVDGILLSGGLDFDPAHYGGAPHSAVRPLHPRRQRSDLVLARLLLDRDFPALGVCCGMQALAIAAGGTLYEDLPTQYPGATLHQGEPGTLVDHPARQAPGSRLASILGAETIVNSSHHQGVKTPGRLTVTSRSPDGLVEGLEHPGGCFLVAVQWHPERILDRPAGGELLRSFVRAAARSPLHGRTTE